MIIELEPELVHRLSKLDSASGTVVEALDAELAAAVRRTALLRRLFYAAVLGVALYGTATGAAAAFGLPWWAAAGGTFTLELGGVVFLANAEVRRRLGESAMVSRLLGVLVSAAAATFNLLTHHSGLLGGFFALMSCLGFLTWWLDTENKRRDRLRARGHLAAPGPVYQLLAHWLRHPILTRRARALADAYPQLGLHGSLHAAQLTIRRERRNAALAAALRRRIRRTVGRRMATIAVRTFDVDQVARRLLDSADYDGLTALLAAELTADRVALPRQSLTTESVATPRQIEAASTAADPNPAAPRPADPMLVAQQLRRAPRHSAHRPSAVDRAAGQNAVQSVAVRVLGTPAIVDAAGQPVPGLRRKSGELLVYLATHRQGARMADITAALWPDVTPTRAAQRLSTCLTNVRGLIRGVMATLPTHQQAEPVVNTAGTYRLNPQAVTVDWWEASTHGPGDSTRDPDRQGGNRTFNPADLVRHHNYPWLEPSGSALRER